MGSGRSGTSMLAGTLAGAGYYMGGRLLRPTPGNPKGYFEAYDIQHINESILAANMPLSLKSKLEQIFMGSIPGKNQRWLSRIPINQDLDVPEWIHDQILMQVSNKPFCFKDPRFCYTLPVWKKFINKPVYFCVFRHPSLTANSILEEQKREPYLNSIRITRKGIYKMWQLMYSRVLMQFSNEGEWVFLHFNQILMPDTYDMLEKKIGGKIDRSFPDKELRTQRDIHPVSKKLQLIYKKLCENAGYNEDTGSNKN